jgi:hypothetical protein
LGSFYYQGDPFVMRKLIYILILIPWLAAWADSPQIDGKFLNNFGRRDDGNMVLLEFNYSLGGPSISDDVFTSNLAPTYNAEIRYGFARYFTKLPLESIYRYNSEYGFLGNISAHFKPSALNEEKPDLTSDTWRFGFALADGYTYNRDEKPYLILYHASSLVWAVVDMEMFPPFNIEERRRLEQFDETFRFGTMFAAGIKARIWETIWADVGYQHQIVFQRHVVPEWVGSAALELALLRWVDYYEKDLIEMHGEYFPALNLIYKTAVSLILYELRRDDMNWPFSGNAPMNFDQFKMGITLLI